MLTCTLHPLPLLPSSPRPPALGLQVCAFDDTLLLHSSVDSPLLFPRVHPASARGASSLSGEQAQGSAAERVAEVVGSEWMGKATPDSDAWALLLRVHEAADQEERGVTPSGGRAKTAGTAVVFPWLDGAGQVDSGCLQGFLRRIVGLVAQRPGIPEVEGGDGRCPGAARGLQ